MTRRAVIFRRLVAILLVWYLGLVAGLPSWEHLTVCFGSDGHIDISFSVCPESPDTRPQTGIHLSGNNRHHGDCVDVKLIPGAFESGRLASAETGSRKVGPEKSDSIRALGNSPSSLFSGGDRIWCAFCQISENAFLSSRLASLRATVLLI